MKKLALIIILILLGVAYMQFSGDDSQTQTQTFTQPFEIYATVVTTGQSLAATREHTPLPATMVPNLANPQQPTQVPQQQVQPTQVQPSQVPQQQVQPSQMQSAIDNVKTTRAIYMTCVAKESLNVMTNGLATCPLEKTMFENAKTVLEAAQRQVTQ